MATFQALSGLRSFKSPGSWLLIVAAKAQAQTDVLAVSPADSEILLLEDPTMNLRLPNAPLDLMGNWALQWSYRGCVV